MDVGGPGLRNRGLSVVKTNVFGHTPYALPGAEALSKNMQKTKEKLRFSL